MEHLHQLGNNVTCPIVIFIRDGQVMTGLRHYWKGTTKEHPVWTHPGGRCDPGETVEQTLRREVAEEVGITDFQIIDFLGTIPGSKQGDTVYAYIGETEQNPKLMEPEKFSEWGWKPLDNLPENLINPTAFELAKNYWTKKNTA